jgi:hypothetical protein
MGLREGCVLRGSFACCDCSFKADSKTTNVHWRRIYSKCSSRAVMHFVRGIFSVVYGYHAIQLGSLSQQVIGVYVFFVFC